MASTFTGFRKRLPLLWKNQHNIPDCSCLYIGCMIFIACCLLAATCFSYGASWTFILIYILLAIAGSIICCISGFKILSKQHTELLPLVSSTSKNPEYETVLKKTSPKDCNLPSFPAESKTKNFSVNHSLHRDTSFHPTPPKIENIDENVEKITCIDSNSNRYAGVYHEQYITAPAPRKRKNQKKKDERQPQTRGALNFVRKIFKLPSVFKRQVSNPTPQAETHLRDYHRNISQEEASPSVELSRSATAEEGGVIPKDIQDSFGMQTERSASTNVLERTYENLLSLGGQTVMTPETSHLSSHTRQDSYASDIQAVNAASPYQNVPSQEHRITDCSQSKLDISSAPTEEFASFSPVARDPSKTYPDYENVFQIRPGYYVPLHCVGPYYNITAACQKNKQLSDTSHSAHRSPTRNYQYSSKADKKSLLSPISISEERIASTGLLAGEEEEVRGKGNHPVDSFHELSDSSPYVNIPASSLQMKKYQQYKDAAENAEQSISSEMQKYSSVPDEISLENVSRTKDKFSKTHSEQNVTSLGYDLSNLNVSPSFDSEQEQTSIPGTSKSLEHVFPSRNPRRFEVEERMLDEPYKRRDMSPIQDYCRTDNDEIKRFFPREELEFHAKEFSNKLYYSISELETKRGDVPQLHCARPFVGYKTEKPESEEDSYSESDSVFEYMHTDSKRKEEVQTRTGTTDAGTFQPDFIHIPDVDTSPTSFIKSVTNSESNESASFNLSPKERNLFDLSRSRERVYQREKHLLASDEHCAREQNIKEYTSRVETGAIPKVRPKKTVTSLRSADDIYPKLHVSKVKINQTEEWHPLPVKRLRDKPSELEEYLGDKTESSDSDREAEKGKGVVAQLERMNVTGIKTHRMPPFMPHSYRLQRPKSVQRNPTDVEREYCNPAVGEGVHSTEKQLIRKEKLPEKIHETEGKKTDVLRSYRPERSTQSQVSERAEARRSSTPEFGDDDPVETEKSLSNWRNETSGSSKEKQSFMEQRIRNRNFYQAECHEDSFGKKEINPRREDKHVKDPITHSLYDSHRLSELRCESQVNEFTSYLNPTEKYASFLEPYTKKSDVSQTVRTAEDIHSNSGDTSKKDLRFVSGCERSRDTVAQYADDEYQLKPHVVRTISSLGSNESLENSSLALPVTKSSHSSETRSPVVSPNQEYSIPKVKTLIQVHRRNPSPLTSNQGGLPGQQRFTAPPPKKIDLPVIRSPLSPDIARYSFTHARSAPVQQMKRMSPSKSLSHRSSELVSRMSRLEYASGFDYKMSEQSPTRTADPFSHSFPPYSQRIPTSLANRRPEDSSVTSGRKLRAKPDLEQQQNLVRVKLPETPLTLLRSPKKTP